MGFINDLFRKSAVLAVFVGSMYCSAVEWVSVPKPVEPMRTKVLLNASRDYNAVGGLPARKLFDYGTRDPHIFNAPDGYYYMVATAASNSLPEPFVSDPKSNFWIINDGIPLWRSKDLENWETAGYVWKFDQEESWVNAYYDREGEQSRAIWAPEITYFKGTYWITYSHNWGKTGILKSLSGKAEGPYAEIQPEKPISDDIDTCLFKDDDDQIYLLEGGYNVGLMKGDMSGLAEPLKKMDFRPSPPWGEGINMQKIDGRYVWTNAGNTMYDWDGNEVRSYDCFSATSDSIYGPYKNRYRAIPFAGHNNLFQDHDGNWYSSLFHASPGFPWDFTPGIVAVEIDDDGILSYKRNYPMPEWKYTFEEPRGNWGGRSFDDSGWKIGEGGFGNKEIEQIGALTCVGTEWDGEMVWMRKQFMLVEKAVSPMLFIRHTGHVEVMINGKEVYKSDAKLQDYITVMLPVDSVRRGSNIIAISAGESDWLNYVDAGIVDKQEFVIQPSAEESQVVWKYTNDNPSGDWFKVGFDASGWNEGKSGFGTFAGSASKFGTRWDSSDIWLRRTFELEKKPVGDVQLKIFFDDSVEVYLNGSEIYSGKMFLVDYKLERLSEDALSKFRVGENVLAVHCRQDDGGQYIDAGLIGVGKSEEEKGVRERTFTYQNPLPFEYEAMGGIRKELRDPCIIREGDTYYLVFTVWPFANREEDRLGMANQGGSPGIKLYSSKDLKNWKFENWLVKADELPEDCEYKNRFWAPEIHKIGGRFYIIFTADNWIKKEYNQAGTWGSAGYAFVGVADKITGPYENITYIDGGACDSSLFEDVDGKTYALIPAYDVFVQEIDLTKIDQGEVKLVGERKLAVKCKNDDIGLDAEADYQEGPWMIEQDGLYVLLYAGPYREKMNDKGRQGYWAGIAYSDNVMGPWKKDPRGQIFHGGHMVMFRGPDERNWFSYRWESSNKHRGLLCVEPFSIDKNGYLQISGPSDYPVTVAIPE